MIYPIKVILLATQFFPDINVVYLGAVTFMAYMIAMIPIFPGGLGGFEGAMISLIAALGGMASDALVVTILFRFVTFWFVFLFSLAFIGISFAADKRRTRYQTGSNPPFAFWGNSKDLKKI